MSENMSKSIGEENAVKENKKRVGRPRVKSRLQKSACVMVNLTQDRKDTLQELADKNNTPISAVVNFAITYYLEVQNKKI